MFWQGERFSLLQIFAIGSGTHPASYSVSKADSFPRCKTTRAWSRSL